jgi:ribosomal protein L32
VRGSCAQSQWPANTSVVESRVVALGWLYLYSRYRKAKRRLRDHDEAAEAANELCNHCGHPQYAHADDEQQTCPMYFGPDDDEEN